MPFSDHSIHTQPTPFILAPTTCDHGTRRQPHVEIDALVQTMGQSSRHPAVTMALGWILPGALPSPPADLQGVHGRLRSRSPLGLSGSDGWLCYEYE
jgi:hypothetical protein